MKKTIFLMVMSLMLLTSLVSAGVQEDLYYKTQCSIPFDGTSATQEDELDNPACDIVGQGNWSSAIVSTTGLVDDGTTSALWDTNKGTLNSTTEYDFSSGSFAVSFFYQKDAPATSGSVFFFGNVDAEQLHSPLYVAYDDRGIWAYSRCHNSDPFEDGWVLNTEHPDGAMYHVVIQYDDDTGELDMFLNGTESYDIETDPTCTALDYNYTPTYLQVGGYHAPFILDDWQYYSGVLDSLQFFNDTLTTEEIAYLGGNGSLPDGDAMFPYDFSPCTPDWECTGYPECGELDTNVSCDTVVDNNACGVAYGGDYSEFDVEVCSQLFEYDEGDVGTAVVSTTAKGLISLFGLLTIVILAGLFAWGKAKFF